MGVVTGGLSHWAIATRCCCPPDSAAGSRRARPVQADLAQHPDDLGPPGPATGQPQRQGEVLVDVEHRQRVGGLKDEADPSATGAVQVALVQAGQLGGAQETPSRRSAGPGPLRTAAGSTFPIRTAHQRRHRTAWEAQARLTQRRHRTGLGPVALGHRDQPDGVRTGPLAHRAIASQALVATEGTIVHIRFLP